MVMSKIFSGYLSNWLKHIKLLGLLVFLYYILSSFFYCVHADQLFDAPSIKEDFVVGRILSVNSPTVNQSLLKGAGLISKQQLVKVKVLEGRYKDLVTTTTNEVTDNPAYNISVKPGNEVILSITSAGGKPEINISDYHRAPAIYILLFVFLAVFLFLGGKTGLKALAGLIITVLLIAYVLLPLSTLGVYPLITAIFICLAATIASMLFICGLTRKAAAAIIGTICGVLIAGIVSSLVIKYAPLTGLSSEEAQILRGSMLIGQDPAFYRGLLAAGMLIGALGVIMDVAISIASSVYEMVKVNPTLSIAELYKSGMNIGRDIMGTMTNTLILAYTGGALPLLLLVSQMPSNKLVNLDLLATEIASALSGGLGLILTIPLTAIAAARLMAKKQI
jgi:uncharacterized membrane protein